MGYRMRVREAEFIIREANHAKALAAVKSLGGKETIEDAGGRHFSWVRMDEFRRAHHVAEALRAWRWSPTFEHPKTEEGDITGIAFIGEKLGDDRVLFEAIAPFVEGGSYIWMTGEDGEHWRWDFDGERCVERKGEVMFAGTPLSVTCPYCGVPAGEHGPGACGSTTYFGKARKAKPRAKLAKKKATQAQEKKKKKKKKRGGA